MQKCSKNRFKIAKNRPIFLKSPVIFVFYESLLPFWIFDLPYLIFFCDSSCIFVCFIFSSCCVGFCAALYAIDSDRENDTDSTPIKTRAYANFEKWF